MIDIEAIGNGLKQGEFFLEYLPIISLEDERCVGAEALIRWQHPSGVLLPDDFIPIAENTPLSGLLTYWVIDTVAAELTDWLRQNDGILLGLNVPPEILGRGGLEYAANKSGLSEFKNKLIMEVTERGVPDQLGLDALNSASRHGVRIALDDVGAGGVNLAILCRAKVDIIKLGKTFMDEILLEDSSPENTQSISTLMSTTDIEIIAEGIESVSQLDILKKAGIKMAQGWYFSPLCPWMPLKHFSTQIRIEKESSVSINRYPARWCHKKLFSQLSEEEIDQIQRHEHSRRFWAGGSETHYPRNGTATSVKEIMTMTEPKMLRIKPAYPERQRIRWTRFGLHMTVGCVLTLYILTGCTVMSRSTKLELTPVTDSPTGIHHQGKFVWNDLLTDDVAAAKNFYGRLFGWTFDQSGTYTVVKNDGHSIGGMVQIGEPSKIKGAARWLCALSLADVDAAAALVSEEGGHVHEGPLDMLNRGRGALVSDPQGAQLVLLHASDGDPADKEPVIGSWLWHELWSNDAEASLTFYRKLAGYNFDGQETDYLILLKDGQWRAGIRYLSNAELEIRWVPVVRVANTEETAEQAKKVGGKVLVEPRSTPSGGSVALLSDPSDALFLIQRWSAEPSEQEK